MQNNIGQGQTRGKKNMKKDASVLEGKNINCSVNTCSFQSSFYNQMLK